MSFKYPGKLLDSGRFVTYTSFDLSGVTEDFITEQADTIKSVLLTLRRTEDRINGTTVSALNFDGYIPPSLESHPRNTVSPVENPRSAIAWLQKHHSGFLDLDFAINVGAVFPNADTSEDGTIQRFFGDAASHARYERQDFAVGTMFNRFFLRNFDPSKNQAVVRVKGCDFNQL